jgi:transcription antitermination factor NusG
MLGNRHIFGNLASHSRVLQLTKLARAPTTPNASGASTRNINHRKIKMNKNQAFAFIYVVVCSLSLALPMRAQVATGAANASTPQSQSGTDPGITPRFVAGEITDLSVAENRMTLRTDAGNTVAVALTSDVAFKRVPPGEKTLTNATAIGATDVGVGDRVIARGSVNVAGRAAAAREVIVMTKADLTAKRAREQAEWSRGVVGTVTAVNPAAKEITVQPRARGFMGGQTPPVVVKAEASDIIFRRYAPNSVRFQDAKTSSFAELKPGDQVRARGERAPDGGQFMPKEIVSGSFRTILGTVATVAPDGNSVTVTPTSGGNPVIVRVESGSTVRRLPEGGMGMGMGGNGGGAPMTRPGERGNAGATGGASRPQGAGMAGGNAGGGVGGGRGVDLSEMLERLPQLTLAQLKPGDMVVVSSTASADPTQVTAIALVAGVERFVNAAQAAAPQGRRQGGGQSLGTGLPGGLDLGIGGP